MLLQKLSFAALFGVALVGCIVVFGTQQSKANHHPIVSIVPSGCSGVLAAPTRGLNTRQPETR